MAKESSPSSTESQNHAPAANPHHWIPACAGMTVPQPGNSDPFEPRINGSGTRSLERERASTAKGLR